jgi:hypothetical protein
MQGCQVLLLLDNCPSHIPLEKFAEMNVVLCNTHIFYLPPNMTSAVQPCDFGIICTFKVYYRKWFNNLLLDGYENNIDNPKKINILDVFRLVVPAWVEDVSPTTIANCFYHCKIWTINIIHTQQVTRSQVTGWNPLESLTKSSCGSWDLEARSRLPTLKRGRGSSWEPRD